MTEEEQPRTYPGSSTPRKMLTGAYEEPDDADFVDWDRWVRPYVVQGETIKFYPMGALCEALNRSAVTLRRWESLGHLPSAAYRTHGKKQDRLYTEPQIRGLRVLAREEGLLDPHKRVPIASTRFPERSRALFARLAKA